MVAATRSRVAKVVAVVFAVAAVSAVVWWAQSRGERVASVAPTRMQERSLRPEPTPAEPVPTPPSILADRPVPVEPAPREPPEGVTGAAFEGMNGKMRDHETDLDPFGRSTYFSSSKSFLAPDFDEPNADTKEMRRKLEEAMKEQLEAPSERLRRDTYFSTSKSAFAPDLDDPPPPQQGPFDLGASKAEVVEPGPDAR